MLVAVMGLTIAYKLSTRRRLNLAGAKKLLAPLRDQAAALGFDEVGPFYEVGPDYNGPFHYPRGAKTVNDLVPPSEGVSFAALPGDGSESIGIGLCRYRGIPGWRFHGFCKTHYASNHGWEHFLRCHRAACDLLRAAEQVGLRVRVTDEGRFWKSRSEWTLFRVIASYNRDLAAFGGAFRDAARAKDEDIQGPIFAHPRFECLEAEGAAILGERLARAVEIATAPAH